MTFSIALVDTLAETWDDARTQHAN